MKRIPMLPAVPAGRRPAAPHPVPAPPPGQHAVQAGRRRRRPEPADIPLEAWAGGLAAAVIIGALAGLLRASRAARLSPTQTLWSI
jgi:hypothetical protein